MNKLFKNIKKTVVATIAAAIMISTVAPATTGNTTTAVAMASTTYSQSKAYTNPVASGTATFRYEDGAVFFSNDKLTDYQLTQENVAAVTSEADQEITQWIDVYGTLWVIYRNQGLYWYNYEIVKKGKLQKWKGEDDSDSNIKAVRLAYHSDNGNKSYVSFEYANYYTSSKDLDDYPLPDWKTLYRVFNGEEYEEKSNTTQTPEPSLEPIITDDPADQTSEPTEDPTSNTTPDPDENQTITQINTTIDWEMEYWAKLYAEGLITWDQLQTIWWQNNWTAEKVELEEEVIYFEYDDEGKLISQHRYTIKNSTESGSSTGEAQVKTEGSSTFQENVVVEGGAQGTLNASTTAITTTNENNSSKAYYTRRVTKRQSQLIKHKNGVDGEVCSVNINTKKHTAKFNNHTYKNVYEVHYSKNSRQIVMLIKKGKYADGKNKYKIKIVQRAKGKAANNWKNRTLKGYFVGIGTNKNDLAIRANRKDGSSKGLKNIQAIKR